MPQTTDYRGLWSHLYELCCMTQLIFIIICPTADTCLALSKVKIGVAGSDPVGLGLGQAV